jgi:hypothetical protein
MISRALLCLTASVLSGACGDGDGSRVPDTMPGAEDRHAAELRVPWTTRQLSGAPARFRPGGWSEENTLWGLVRGRVTSVDVRTGAVRELPHAAAWWVQGGAGVITWRNEQGLFVLRGGAAPVRLPFDPEVAPSVLWSPDATRAVLTFEDEAGEFALLNADGSTRALVARIPGYYYDSPVLWLDSTRVLFQTVANGPISGPPSYRESGWRGDLAVLDVSSAEYRRVTGVPDGVYLRVAGRYIDDILVTEWGEGRVPAQATYDPRTWSRRPTSLPTGRAFASVAGAVVVLLHPEPDTTTAVLVAGGDTTVLGVVARDAEPVFSPSGRIGALRTSEGVWLFERSRQW